MNISIEKPAVIHIGFLDLLRGFLAFWVYYGHLKMAAIGKDVLWGSPAIAVDGFMLLSGFLMAYHWILRENRFSGFWDQVKDFYLRRFFRIAPLYYLLLTIVLIWQNELIQVKTFVNRIVPPAWGGAVTVMDNPDFLPVDFWNVFTHYSFSFGLIPKYVNVNMLPDWSIGLEMQFYLIFPLLFWLIAKYGGTFITFLVFLVTIAASKFIGLFNHAGLIARYPQPSLILFKLNFFLAGMAVAYAYLSKTNRQRVFWVILAGLALFNAKRQVLIIFSLILLTLLFDQEKEGFFTRMGNWKVSKFLGDTSYGLYLVHLPVIYPILQVLFKQEWYSSLAIYPRLLVTMLIASPAVYAISYLLHTTVEINGIKLGKSITAKLSREEGRLYPPTGS